MRLKQLPIHEIMSENARRRALNAAEYNPVTGIGCCGERVRVASPVDGGISYVPAALLDDPDYELARNSPTVWQKLRFRHDFEYWAATAVRIKDKLSGRDVPLILNRAQRLVLETLEKQRLAGAPIRIIILKARQWGGSTLVQMYMAWIQSVHRENWHSLICAHVKDAAAGIRGMYTRMLDNYPRALWINSPSFAEGDDGAPRFRPFERSINTREIVGRGCRVTVGSAENQEAVRGADLAMAHLSEAAFWGDSTRRNPEDFIRAVCSGIMLEPLTLIAVESTANGVGNWFHREWLRAEKGLSDKIPIFVPWYYIDIYEQPVSADEIPSLIDGLGDYEENLWECSESVTLEKLKWYGNKSREYAVVSQMHAEFPSNAVEAFTSTGKGVFDIRAVDRMRRSCRERRELLRGEISGQKFVYDSTGCLLIVPEALESLRHGHGTLYRYVIGVDVGGRSAGCLMPHRHRGARPLRHQATGHSGVHCPMDRALRL